MPSKKSAPFEVTIKHRLSLRERHGVTMVDLEVSLSDQNGEQTNFAFDLPLPPGENPELQAYKLDVFTRNMLPTTLALLYGSAFRFLANTCFVKAGLLSATFADAVHAFEKDVAGDVRAMVGLPKRGNPSKWRKAELLARVQSLVNENNYIMWEEINDNLKKTDPERASPNGKALQEKARKMGILIRDVRRKARMKRKNPE